MNNNDSVKNNPEENDNKQVTNEELEQIKNELNECRNQLIRIQADMENQRKRMDREVKSVKMFAIQNFVLELLPAKDGLEKGIELAMEDENTDSQAIIEGIKATLSLCDAAFMKAGLEEIDPIGKVFDPAFHEAMSVKKTQDIEPNQVIKVFQKGCILNGRLIRPARVEVSSSL